VVANLDLVPITDLTFASTSLMRDDGVFLQLKRGFGEIPTVRGVDQLVPRRAGRIPRSRVAERLDIELEGLVRGIPDEADNDPSEAEAYYALVEELVTLFDPTANERALSFLHPDGTTRSINCRVVPPLLWDEQIPGRLARLNVSLVAVDDPSWSSSGP
jgi:hypothetical protein